ncbi:MAG: Gfo/Idh/MocA family oxidoreductase [Candidatus Micrarchaeia archaeon]
MNVGLLGYGSIAKAHVHAYRDIPVFFPKSNGEIKVKWIFGREKQRAENFAKTYGIEKYTTVVDDILKDDSVSIIDNVLPNKYHYELCIRAIEAGKNVICEKPLALNFKQAVEMYVRAEKQGIVHGVMFNYRFLPAIRLAKKIINEGMLGKIYHFRAVYLEDFALDPTSPLVWRYIKSEAGSGSLGDDGSHIVDMARYLVGEIKRVCGISKIYIKERPMPSNNSKKGYVETDDQFLALLEFENNVAGSLEASRVCAGRKNYQYIEINGSEGSLYWNLEKLNELYLYTVKDGQYAGFKNIMVTDPLHPYIRNFWPPGSIISWADSFVIALYEYVNAVSQGKPFESNFYDGAANLAVLDAIQRSIEEKRWIEVERMQK